MSSSSEQFCPGMPAAYCRTYETAIDLQAMAEALLPTQLRLVWLDSARPHQRTGRYSILGWDPWLTFSTVGSSVTVVTSASTVQTADHPLDVLRRLLARYHGPSHPSLPPIGVGWFGALSYSLNRWIERLPDPKPADVAVPDLLFFGMRMLLIVDQATDRSWRVSVVDPHQPPPRALREARTRLEAIDSLISSLTPRASSASPPIVEPFDGHGDVTPTTSQAQFEAMVRRAKAFIHAGEIFQANLAQRFSAPWSGSPWPLYRALRQVNPSPFACFLTAPELTLVSCSPERLVQLHDGVVQTRPIAGTRPRGASPKDDVVNSLELMLSDKERAEHLMLVDLARNDVGRICNWGSVHVDELMALEDYSHVMHIVSNVRGRLRHGLGAVDVIRAMFPGGTITGCPKIRSMEIIHDLEPVGRGLYTGSCGWLGFDGSLDLNILIRTILIQRQTLTFHVGAGIVADSDPTREYHETLAKAAALRHAIHSASRNVFNSQCRNKVGTVHKSARC